MFDTEGGGKKTIVVVRVTVIVEISQQYFVGITTSVTNCS
jgi:hypothetical protein